MEHFYLDSHCHLNDETLYIELGSVLARARETGVKNILVIGWDLESSKKAIEIAEANENVYAAVGFHPENLENISEEAVLEIEKLAHHEKVMAIGEIGLDYHWFKEQADRDNQKKWFIRQIELANKLNLPCSIHARDASGDTYQLLKEHPIHASAVLHCYSGSSEMLREFAKLGYYFG
ncbi:MAG: TatD family hydrolase, partial [Bacilli bacterium]|nr:TatD family hydrolase [Bacilli bacterium]